MSSSSSSTRRARAARASSRSRGTCTASVASARAGRRSRARSAAGSGSGSRRISGRTARSSPRSSRADTCSLAGYTGTMPSVCTVSPSSSSRISWLLTTNVARPPCGRYVPRTLSRMPSASTLTRYRWLNQTASTAPVSSREHDAHDVHAAARRALGDDAPDGAAHRRLLADLEVADELAVAEVLVAAREVVDEVAHGLEAEGREAPGDRLGDVLQLGQRPGERGGVEEESRGGRPFVVPAAAEAERECGLGHSAIMAKAAVPGPMCVPTTAPQWPWSTKCALGRSRSIISRMSCGSSSLMASMVTKYSSSSGLLFSSTKRSMAARAFLRPRTLA